MAWFRRMVSTRSPHSTILIRLMVGAVFLSEGLQKFLDPATRGAGRFEKIGLPMPELLGSLVGGFEVACGALILIGLATRVAAIPLIVIMLTAIVTTKVPIYLEKGFWQVAHDARTDWAMLLGSLYLLIQGAGPWSIDSLLGKGK